MLQILDIKKQYITGELVQTALDGVSLTLRDNEFVAILGPSGSGKTTLLNVIGGLDRYDSGDLIINGISTKKYSDRDWDSYRNHTIGFVFQSYNLIPHQTVLANVELALTISGISRAERRKRAVKALEDVGLGNQLHKRPNQMSGGQMQRVAIARALVNNPDILLADEPTGALDSETSVQVMELLKEVSKDRLVVMVTHNPELAEMYANRIVRVKDGKIIGDTNPCIVDANTAEPPKHKNMGRASMSFLTALSLSFNNLRTKMGRTLLTAFAGSIGIIGIALIMSLSTGFQNYIDKIQEDTLSNYPLTLQSETADMTALMSAYGSMLLSEKTIEPEMVEEQQMISQMFAQVGTNDLSAFKTHMESNMDQIADDINNLKYSYGIRPLIYLADTSENITQVNPGVLFGQLTGMSSMSAYMDSNIFYEMIDNRELLTAQYDVLRGRWPENADEVLFVLSAPDQITDYTAYTLGLKETDELAEMMEKVMEGEDAGEPSAPQQWSYDDLLELELRLVPSASKYKYNSEYAVWEDMSEDTSYMKARIENGRPLKIVGIVCPKEGTSTTLLQEGIAYTSDLTKLVIEDASQSQIVINQLNNPDVDVFTGTGFGEVGENDDLNFEDMISVDGDKITSAFGMDVDAKALMRLLENQIKSAYNSLDIDAAQAKKDFVNTFNILATDMLNSYIAEKADPDTGKAIIRVADMGGIVNTYLSSDIAASTVKKLAKEYRYSSETLLQVYEPLLVGMLSAYVAADPVLPDLPDVPAIPEVPDVTVPEEGTPEETLPQEPEESIPDSENPDSPIEDEFASDTGMQNSMEPLSLSPIMQRSNGAMIMSVNDGSLDSGIPEETTEGIKETISAIYATITLENVDAVVSGYMSHPAVDKAANVISVTMMKEEIMDQLEDKVAGLIKKVMRYVGNSFQVDEEMLASAFSFNMNEDELRRLMSAMAGTEEERSYTANLRKLGYADLDKPIAISLYFVDFEAKSNFLEFLDNYNLDMEEQGLEDYVIRYTDITNIMMSSVRTIIDSVSYVLIAFVAVSLIVSSIMIGIITYISVMERTKEIGILRAIGASKSNISQVFNAETFIIGLCSGLIGVGLTIVLNIPINYIIHHLTDNPNIHAQLPVVSAVVLILLSMLLTLIGGLIPSKHAAKKDPVIALRSE